MEFPELGKQCCFVECKQLDFLPTECTYCHNVFCRNHFFPSSHQCADIVVKKADCPSTGEWFACAFEKCNKRDAIQMSCVKCSLHHCVTHRYHSCFDITPSQARVEKERAPKIQFQIAKEISDRIVEDKLKNAKNRATANKIKLIRIKGFAVGDNKVPNSERLFLSVCPPQGENKTSESKSYFVSKNWSLGKCIDALAKKMKLINQNLDPSANKLRLFTSDGIMLGPAQDIVVQNYLDDGTLIDGDNVILEYVSQADLLGSDLVQIPVENIYKWTK